MLKGHWNGNWKIVNYIHQGPSTLGYSVPAKIPVLISVLEKQIISKPISFTHHFIVLQFFAEFPCTCSQLLTRPIVIWMLNWAEYSGWPTCMVGIWDLSCRLKPIKWPVRMTWASSQHSSSSLKAHEFWCIGKMLQSFLWYNLRNYISSFQQNP